MSSNTKMQAPVARRQITPPTHNFLELSFSARRESHLHSDAIAIGLVRGLIDLTDGTLKRKAINNLIREALGACRGVLSSRRRGQTECRPARRSWIQDG